MCANPYRPFRGGRIRPIEEMVTEALKHHHRGASLIAIKRYIVKEYSCDLRRITSELYDHLKKARANGMITINQSGSYQLTPRALDAEDDDADSVVLLESNLSTNVVVTGIGANEQRKKRPKKPESIADDCTVGSCDSEGNKYSPDARIIGRSYLREWNAFKDEGHPLFDIKNDVIILYHDDHESSGKIEIVNMNHVKIDREFIKQEVRKELNLFDDSWFTKKEIEEAKIHYRRRPIDIEDSYNLFADPVSGKKKRVSPFDIYVDD